MHGAETSLGNWHENVARIIAKDKFKKAEKLQGKNKLKGYVSLKAMNQIENILSDLDSGKRKPDNKSETKKISKVSQDGKKVARSQTVDLFLESDDGKEIYLEIKGPKPNKNEMRAAKRDLFEIYAMRALEGKQVKIYLGMYYNTYEPQKYQRWTVLKFFDIDHDFLVGESFWDFLGGDGTYKQLIEIYEDIGNTIRPILDKKLAELKKK